MPQPEEEHDPNTEAEAETQTIHSSNGATITEEERETHDRGNNTHLDNMPVNGEIPVAQQESYLRGENNNIEGGSNANTNS